MSDNPKIQNPRKYTKRLVKAASYEYWLPAHKADTTFEGNHVLILNADAFRFF